jgi:hypothetical protein
LGERFQDIKRVSDHTSDSTGKGTGSEFQIERGYVCLKGKIKSQKVIRFLEIVERTNYLD